MKILIVEDDPTNLKLFSYLLKNAGYKTLQTKDGNTGIAMAREELPDLILMDIQLPGMDGLTTTRILKGDSKTCHIPIIALTAFAMKGDKEKMLGAGCDFYIAKPIRYKEFLECVESYLKQKNQKSLS